MSARDMGPPSTARGAKVALLVTALFWLMVWLVVGARVGVEMRWLVAFAVTIAALAVVGYASFARSAARRYALAGVAVAIAGMLAFATFMDLALVGGALAVAFAAWMPVNEAASAP